MLRKLLIALAIVILAPVLALLFWPSPIDPVAYNPPPAPPMTGVLAPNKELQKAELLGLGRVIGAEDVAVDAAGRVYGGTLDGSIMRVLPGGEVEKFATTGGRPLGLHFDRQGNLIVADAVKGLLAVAPDGSVSTLLTEAGGVPLGFTDDLDIANDGTIYFSDASSKFGIDRYLLDLLEGRPHGRLPSYNPGTGQARVLLRGLYFANGVALSSREEFVLVNETTRFRITRYWLKGPRAGRSDVFAENLPGYPDGISSDRKGTFWLALISPRKERLEQMLSPSPFLKNIVAKLPAFMQPGPTPYGLVAALDEQGRIVRSLHDPEGSTMMEISSAQAHGGYLYLGTLHNDRIGRLKL